MALGSKIENGARLVFVKKRADQCFVTNIAMDEDVAGMMFNSLQVAAISSIGEQVEIDDAGVSFCNPVEHKICADEPSPAGYQDGIVHSKPLTRRSMNDADRCRTQRKLREQL